MESEVSGFKFQSTHPHGVRRRRVAGNGRTRCFNPRTHTGCDSLLSCIGCGIIRFQSTHPHGVRLAAISSITSILLFQSTHPHGVRQEGDNEQIFQYQVSIHAPTRGATKIKIKILLHASVSIHAPTRGATHLANSPARNTGVSIHAPTRGATRTRIVISGSEAVSIHAPTRGATWYCTR